jgi:hypothetical protein
VTTKTHDNTLQHGSDKFIRGIDLCAILSRILLMLRSAHAHHVLGIHNLGRMIPAYNWMNHLRKFPIFINHKGRAMHRI